MYEASTRIWRNSKSMLRASMSGTAIGWQGKYSARWQGPLLRIAEVRRSGPDVRNRCEADVRAGQACDGTGPKAVCDPTPKRTPTATNSAAPGLNHLGAMWEARR